MSIFNTAQCTCPECGDKIEISWAASVNADRRPDLRDAVLDRSFQAEACPTCGYRMRLPPHLTYVDMARGDWVLVNAAADLGAWATHEAEAQQLFDESFGAAAPESMREMAEGVRPRIAFGWPALREKIVCTGLGLEDITLELLKMGMMRSMRGIALGGPSLRLVAGDATTLTFDLVDDGTEETTLTAEVPRSLYDDIAGDAASWATLRGRLEGKALVDVLRFTLEG